VIPLSVDPLPFMEATPYLPPEDKPRLLFVGRHRYYKGVGTLLKALTYVDAHLLIGGDGPMRSKWEQMSRELNLGERVRFVGEVSDEDLPRLYASADIFVLPANARAEAFGTVLLEAMAAGLPCVTTEVGSGTSFVVQNGVTGLVVPPAEPHALAEALNVLIADPLLRRQMGMAGRARAVQEFGPAALLRRVTAIYETILGADIKR
jgi:rhamnosyl/mannosyltransferase